MSLYWSAPYLLKFCNFCLFNPDFKITLKIFFFWLLFSLWFWTLSAFIIWCIITDTLIFESLTFWRYYITETVTLPSSEETGSENRSAWPYYHFLTLFTYFRSLGLSTVIVENIACAACSLRCCLYFYLTTCLKVVVTTCLIIHVIDSRRMLWDFVWAVRRGTLHGLFCT